MPRFEQTGEIAHREQSCFGVIAEDFSTAVDNLTVWRLIISLNSFFQILKSGRNLFAFGRFPMLFHFHALTFKVIPLLCDPGLRVPIRVAGRS